MNTDQKATIDPRVRALVTEIWHEQLHVHSATAKVLGLSTTVTRRLLSDLDLIPKIKLRIYIKKLDFAKASTIRDRLAAGELPATLAAEYDVSPTTISLIKNNRVYKA